MSCCAQPTAACLCVPVPALFSQVSPSVLHSVDSDNYSTTTSTDTRSACAAAAPAALTAACRRSLQPGSERPLYRPRAACASIDGSLRLGSCCRHELDADRRAQGGTKPATGLSPYPGASPGEVVATATSSRASPATTAPSLAGRADSAQLGTPGEPTPHPNPLGFGSLWLVTG
jgi:hypothetical protein